MKSDNKWNAHWISNDIDQRTLREVMDEHVEKVIIQCHGNMTVAALVLGVSRAGVINYARALGIDVDSLRKKKKY